jgi:hypothetical protein
MIQKMKYQIISNYAIEFKIASIRFDEKDEFLNDTVSKRF